MSMPKTFLRILTIKSMNPIIHHVLFFKFQILEKMRSSPCFMRVVSMFYALFPYQLYIPILRSMMLVQAIKIVSSRMSISWRDFQLIISMQRRRQKLFCVSWPVIFMYQIGHHVTWFKFWKKDEIVFMLLCSLCVDGSINSDSMHPIGIQVPWFKF
jgi:hypothetical protein